VFCPVRSFFVAKTNLKEVLTVEIERAEKILSARKTAPQNFQLQLFEELEDYNALQKKKNPKNSAGLTISQEVFARLLACGLTKTEAYIRAYELTNYKLSTVYPKACRLSKEDKIVARVEALRREIEDKALMSPTEFYQIITEKARKEGKEQAWALEQVGKCLGVYKADKGLPGSADAPFVIKYLDEETPVATVGGFSGGKA